MGTRHGKFVAAFAITAIVLGALCAFAAVDLSSDKYMPGQFGPFFQIGSINSRSASITLLGKEYVIGGETREGVGEIIYRYRGFLPSAPRLVGKLIDIAADINL